MLTSTFRSTHRTKHASQCGTANVHVCWYAKWKSFLPPLLCLNMVLKPVVKPISLCFIGLLSNSDEPLPQGFPQVELWFYSASFTPGPLKCSKGKLVSSGHLFGWDGSSAAAAVSLRRWRSALTDSRRWLELTWRRDVCQCSDCSSRRASKRRPRPPPCCDRRSEMGVTMIKSAFTLRLCVVGASARVRLDVCVCVRPKFKCVRGRVGVYMVLSPSGLYRHRVLPLPLSSTHSSVTPHQLICLLWTDTQGKKKRRRRWQLQKCWVTQKMWSFFALLKGKWWFAF